MKKKWNKLENVYHKFDDFYKETDVMHRIDQFVGNYSLLSICIDKIQSTGKSNEQIVEGNILQ